MLLDMRFSHLRDKLISEVFHDQKFSYMQPRYFTSKACEYAKLIMADRELREFCRKRFGTPSRNRRSSEQNTG